MVFAGLSAMAGLVSHGFLEADGCVHFLFARFAFQEPYYFVNVWGRPFVTAIYALPASIGASETGRALARLTSLAMALVIALVTYRIARRQGYRYPQLAFLFVLAQPLLFLHSFSTLTEVPFAMLLVLAFAAYQRRWFLAMTLLIALTPLARPEGFGFLLLAATALVFHRRYAWLLLLPLPLFLWNYAGWVMYGRAGAWWGWLMENWPYAEQSLYERGSIFHFVMRLPVIVSPLIFPALGIGVWRSFADAGDEETGQRTTIVKYVRKSLFSEHLRRCDFLIAAIPLLILAVHSVLYWMGKMASNGEMRYLLVVSPFWALLAARGWVWVWERMNWKHPMAWAGAAALAPLIVQAAYPIVPLKMTGDWRAAKVVADWYQATPLRNEYPNLSASHPAIWYFLDRSPNGEGTLPWGRDLIDRAPDGTMILWDRVYGVYNSDAKRSVSLEGIKADGWIEDWRDEDNIAVRGGTAGGDAPGIKIFLSPKTIQGRKTIVEPRLGPHILGFNAPR